MHPQAILAPMGTLAGLTFLVLVLIPIARFRAAFAGRVTARDFLLGESSRVPEDVSVMNRNYMNLLEGPVLFYVLCLSCLAAAKLDRTLLTLAWVYVALRVLHSLVHIAYNNVFHRLALFASSSAVLTTMWVYFYVQFYL